jgi:hypothetical protein
MLVLANLMSQLKMYQLAFLIRELGITDNTSFVVSDATMSIPTGEFRIYGNKVLHWQLLITKKQLQLLYPNPASDYFTLNRNGF